MNFKNMTYSVPWNLFLITLGSIIFALGVKGIIIPHGMITGGFSGLGLLLLYTTNLMTPGLWYLILNIPVFILGWIFVSKRFFYYSLYGMICLSLMIELIHVDFHITDHWLAALAGGTMFGGGCGMIFRSLGSAGGNDIVSIILNQKFGVRIGSFNFLFNFILFLFSFGTLDTDIILYSMAMSYIASEMMEYCITLFNQRKMIIVISEKNDEIAHAINHKLRRGATLLKGKGAYTQKEKEVLLTVANTFQIKRVEEIVFNTDPNAFMITENTFNVLGKGFSQRKVY
ncbi:MAG: hypothetical protein CSA29_01780 [Desulfobacterales bacterium]|nr:MAG: hypothetical protein CSA29_01780 [Desulfobacterales bacterium]